MSKNYMTFKELDAKCRHLSKISDKEIAPGVRQKIINDLIYKLYGLLDGVNHPFWNRTITLTVAADAEQLKDTVTNSGTITAIDSTAKTITRSSGTFAAGAILDIVVVTKSTSLVAGQWKARVSVAGATGTYVKIGSGTEITFNSATQVCFVNVMKKLSASSASLDNDYVKQVVKVFDDQGTGNKERVFTQYKDAERFGNAWDDPFMVSEMAWYQRGGDIDIFVGSSATAAGVVQAEVVTKPALYTDATASNDLDFPPEENSMVTDEITAEFLRTANKDVPSELTQRLGLYAKRYEASAGDRQKAMEIKGR